MPNATRSPRKDASPNGTRLEELAREVFAIRSALVVMRKELTDLRQQLATKVRTRRLVVVDQDGSRASRPRLCTRAARSRSDLVSDRGGRPNVRRALRQC